MSDIIFQNDNGHALRILWALRTDTREYCISKIGNVIIAYPSEDPWAPVRQVIGTFPDDFMSDREQPQKTTRTT